MKFKKVNGRYQARKSSGVIVTIEKTEYTGNWQWVVRYSGDHNGDNTSYASTKRELVDSEKSWEV